MTSPELCTVENVAGSVGDIGGDTVPDGEASVGGDGTNADCEVDPGDRGRRVLTWALQVKSSTAPRMV